MTNPIGTRQRLRKMISEASTPSSTMKHCPWLLAFALLSTACASDSADSDAEPAKQRETEKDSQPRAEPAPEPAAPAPEGGDVAAVDGELEATETNVAAAPCLADVDCPTGVRCIAFGDAGSGPGFCDVLDVAAP